MAAQYGQSGPTEKATVKCQGCGYDLRAHDIGARCPECGRTTFDIQGFDGTRRLKAYSETGSGLLKLSFILAIIPITGLLMIAKFGAVLAFLAAFGPIFHLASVWSFRSSKLNAIPEAKPWRRNWMPAAVEALVACFAIIAAIHLQSQVKPTTAWIVAIVIWPPVLGVRLAMTAHGAGVVLSDYGLRLFSIISVITAVASIVAGIGIGVTTLAVIDQSNQAVALSYAIPGAIVFGGLGLLCCWLSAQATSYVESNLLWDLINQHIESKEEAQTAFANNPTRRMKKELPPIPLAEEDFD